MTKMKTKTKKKHNGLYNSVGQRWSTVFKIF
jgi:hypothetical protein